MRLSKLSMRVASLVCAVTGACGDDGDGGGGEQILAPGIVNRTEARASVDTFNKVISSMSAMNGNDVLEALEAMIRAGQGVVIEGEKVDDLEGVLVVIPTSVPRPTHGSVDCTATSCSFTDYGYAATGTVYAISGTVTRSSDTYTFSIDYGQTTHSGDMSWTIDGAITKATTGVDGQLHFHGKGRSDLTQTMDDVTWDVAVDYDAIVLDAQACPTGGSMHAITRYEGPGSDAKHGLSFYVEGLATFGPTCGA